MKQSKTLCEKLASLPDPLQSLGMKPFFQQQLTLEDYSDRILARVIAHNRNGYVLAGENGEIHLRMNASLPGMTVGDWVILDSNQHFIRLLDRFSLFSRKAAGSEVSEQLIAANIDTIFIVCSLNHDFNLNRIERYLSLVKSAGVEPVIVLTKADLCNNAETLKNQVQGLDPLLMVETVNALDHQSVSCLLPWCGKGQTIACIGSSGVGKSTLINTLLGEKEQTTGTIREDDSKGRHTTTSRSIHLLNSGGLLLDTPGMREIQLVDCETGISETFADIEGLSQQCRFNDCQHQSEPGCAVLAAIEEGSLDIRRLTNYQKLLREQAHNTATLAEQRSRNRQLGKYIRNIQEGKRKIKENY